MQFCKTFSTQNSKLRSNPMCFCVEKQWRVHLPVSCHRLSADGVLFLLMAVQDDPSDTVCFQNTFTFQTQSVSKTFLLFAQIWKHCLLPEVLAHSTQPRRITINGAQMSMGQTDGKTTTTTIMDNMQETSQWGVLFYSKKKWWTMFYYNKQNYVAPSSNVYLASKLALVVVFERLSLFSKSLWIFNLWACMFALAVNVLEQMLHL